ncbi:reverse transcriptase/maturase family protein [Capnocytophaga cynodegmi]|uniref:Reverse transcriptase (RNA-dependent DNA polymerase) n=1 Tax=Capnocytophaga cynodegmi TaxID=28189 RepID=A0A0B7H9V1_9FLAO|nr:reverse transcriptase/maturase family protein [Capnocytophaga cynodegmi]CEN35314.1 Reverse transcriptase (RNA-dependent DNA polymerase) [Capnocytophaga cynodegmi]CEN39641.1 Reverse transcriptase (RNA-dependent DNA polymerase) [Capnocytophaga cynodegmi]
MKDIVRKYFSQDTLNHIFDSKIVKNKSKGIDKKTYKFYTEKSCKQELISTIESKIVNEKYHFSPYLELLKIKRRNTPPRVLSIPTVRDKIVLQILKNYLHDVFPEVINKEQPNSYIRKIKNFIRHHKNNKIYCLRTDINQFYDTISRSKLKKAVKIKSKNRYINKFLFLSIENPTVPHDYKRNNISQYKLKKGIPQGLPISNILAQIYLQNLDTSINGIIDENTLYLRYVDDILILSTKNCSDYLNRIKTELKELGLKLNSDKTFVGELSESIFYLGYLIKDTSISVSKQTIENQVNKIAGKVTWFKKGIENTNFMPARYKNNPKEFSEQFIKEVNEIITGSKNENKNYGWLFYYIEIDDVSALYKLDNIIRKMIQNIPFFQGKIPHQLKSFVKAYNEIKYKPETSEYINDYTKYKTMEQKKELLKEFSQLEEQKDHSNEEIDSLFEEFKNNRLNFLKENIVY